MNTAVLAFALVLVVLVGVFCVIRWSGRQTQAGQFTLLAQARCPIATLACIAGPQQGRSYPLGKRQVVLGRASRCDIVIPADLVSRQHALITCADKYHILYDQDSTNGTWVNGQRIKQHILQPLDQIQIGPSILVLQVPGQAVPTPSPIPVAPTPPAPSLAVHDIADYDLLDTRPGGVATVYKARSHHDGTIVAIKVLHSQDPYIKDKFVKEIQVGRSLRHPHVVSVYGGGESHGLQYMVMEFISEGTLRDRMFPGHPLPIDFTISVTGQMCDALAYAHQKGVYHRDIKPENILFETEQVAKLCDFGIARLAQAVTRTALGVVVGTPFYMSFEQAKGHEIDHRTDIYSLGVVLYEMTTGTPPFVADDPLTVVDMHIRDNPVPPRKIRPEIPDRVEQVILHAMEKDRSRRFHSAQEMARALGYTAPMYSDGDGLVGQAEQPRKTEPAPASALLLVRSDGAKILLGSGGTPLHRRQVNPGDSEISRRHAQVRCQHGQWWLEDLGSVNGSYVNNMRVFEAVMLQPGDEIRLGRTILHVVRP